MRRNYQLIVDSKRGDCFRACVTSILGIPNNPAWLPDAGDERWFPKFYSFLYKFGIEIIWEPKACWRDGYWIASVPSKNYQSVTHAIVMKGQRVAWDPGTKKRYCAGISLLGKSIVDGGWYLELTDPGKIARLIAFRKKYSR